MWGEYHDYTTIDGRITSDYYSKGGASISSTSHYLYFIYDNSGSPIGFKVLSSSSQPTGVYTYLKNLQGDVIGIVDESGKQVASYSYDAWGNIISQSGALAEINPIRYKGYYYDSDTGMYYLQSRYYDPSLHRFINADDPSLIVGLSKNSVIGANLYAYCENNGVNYDDLSGSRRKAHPHQHNFDFNAAMSYARKWWNKRNPEFTYDSNAADCANFVSQCLYAGGHRRESNWYYNRVYFWGKWRKIKVGDNWGKADGLYQFAKEKSKNKKLDRFSNKLEINNNTDLKKAINSKKYQKGKSIAFFVYKNSGKAWHAVFVGTSTKSNIYYWAHTTNRNGDTESSNGFSEVLKNGTNKIVIFTIKESWYAYG